MATTNLSGGRRTTMTTYRVIWDDYQYEETLEARTDDDAIAIAYADAARWLDPGTKTELQIFRKDEDDTEVFLGYVRKLIPWQNLKLVYDSGDDMHEVDAESRDGIRHLEEWRDPGSGVDGRTRVYLHGDLAAVPDLVDWTGFDEALGS